MHYVDVDSGGQKALKATKTARSYDLCPAEPWWPVQRTKAKAPMLQRPPKHSGNALIAAKPDALRPKILKTSSLQRFNAWRFKDSKGPNVAPKLGTQLIRISTSLFQTLGAYVNLAP